jgi:hypothetical protein
MAAAPIIAGLVKDARQRAQEEHERWLIQRQKWECEEATRHKQATEARKIKAYESSKQDLIKLAEDWILANQMENFLDSVQSETSTLPEQDRNHVYKRIQAARHMLGGIEASRHFSRWRLPEEIDLEAFKPE